MTPESTGPIVRTAPGPAETEPARRRLWFAYSLPVLLLSTIAVWPLIAGQRTLYLRDVLNTHFPMKWFQAQAMHEGRLPLVDPYRAGGQAHLGNPNTVPLYPDNLLYLVADSFWALNAHFWLHLLIAPACGYLLGRGWGLRREAAWAVGVCYGTSGHYLSQFNFYNLVGPATLAPALIGVALRIGGASTSRGWFVGSALLWALMLLGGDPVTAVLALGLALSAVAIRYGRGYRWRAAGVAFLSGSAIAAPQWIEFARIVGLSYRGLWGFSPEGALVGSFNPLAFPDLLMPFPYGRPDYLYWGRAFYGGGLPLFFSLFPGVLALALVAIAPRRSRPAAWAWLLVVAGAGAALGQFNPVMRWLLRLPAADLFRLPVKLWLAVALGASLLCGLGAAALFEERHRQRFRPALLVMSLIYLTAWAALTLAPTWSEGRLRAMIPNRFSDAFVAQERVRWAGTFLLTLAVISLLLVALWLSRRPQRSLPLLLSVHAASQLFLLRPLLASDDLAAYRRPPELAAAIPSGSRVVFGEFNDLFGPLAIDVARFPDGRTLWSQRMLYGTLHPWSGVQRGLRYEFNISPEGLNAFLTQITFQTMMEQSDARRLRLLQAAGVEYLILSRALEAEATAAVAVEEVARHSWPAGTARVYRLLDPVPPVVLAGEVWGVDSLNEAFEPLLGANFDSRRQAILAGSLPRRSGPPGTARLLEEHDESLLVEVDSEQGGALVVQRTHLPLYRASVDGIPERVVAANLHRLAVLVPAGEHRVRLWVDRRPFAGSLALVALGLVGLVVGLRLVPSLPRP